MITTKTKNYISGFPQNQAQMAEWRKKYKFDPKATAFGQKGAWYDSMAEVAPTPVPTSAPIPAPALSVSKQMYSLIKPDGTKSQYHITPEKLQEYLNQGYSMAGGQATPTPAPTATPTPKAVPGAITGAVEDIKEPAIVPQEQITESADSYSIKAGDTLSGISAKLGVSVEDILAVNPEITNPDVIYAGQMLNIPSALETAPGEADVADVVDTEVKEATDTLETGDTTESKIKEMIRLAAELGIKYPEEAIEALTASQDKSVEELREEIETKYGLEDIETKVFEKPEQSWGDIYQAVYKDLGLDKLKVEIKTILDEIDKAQANFNEARSEIQENPWLPQSSMVGRVKRLRDTANAKLSRLGNKATLMNSMLDRGVSDARYFANKALETWAIGKEIDQKILANIQIKIERELAATLALQETTQEKQSFRYYPEYLENLPVEEPSYKTPTTKQMGDRWYQWNEKMGAWEDMGIGKAGGGNGGGGGAVFETESGEKIDITSPDGLKRAFELGYSYEYLNGLMDTETKLDKASREGLLKEAGGVSIKEKETEEKEKKEEKENAMSDLKATIEEYKELWKKEGDDNIYGTREEFKERIKGSFSELTEDEIMKMIYEEVSNEWLQENKTWWGKRPGLDWW